MKRGPRGIFGRQTQYSNVGFPNKRILRSNEGEEESEVFLLVGSICCSSDRERLLERERERQRERKTEKERDDALPEPFDERQPRRR